MDKVHVTKVRAEGPAWKCLAQRKDGRMEKALQDGKGLSLGLHGWRPGRGERDQRQGFPSCEHLQHRLKQSNPPLRSYATGALLLIRSLLLLPSQPASILQNGLIQETKAF